MRESIINFAVFLPYILLSVLATEIVYERFHHIDFLYKWAPWLPIGVFLILIITFPIVSRFSARNFSWSHRDAYERFVTKSFAASVLFLLLVPVFWAVSYAVETSPEQINEEWDRLLQRGPENYHILFAIVAVSAALMFLVGASGDLSKLSSKLGLYVAGVIGPLFLFSVYLGLCVLQVDSHFIDDSESKYSKLLEEGTVSPALVEQFEIRGITRIRGVTILPKDSTPGFGPQWVVNFEGGTCPVQKDGETLEISCYDLWDDDGDFLFLSVTVLSLYYCLFFVDVNLTSIHSFYRDRLSKAYLIQAGQDGEIKFNDDQKLSGLNSGEFRLCSG